MNQSGQSGSNHCYQTDLSQSTLSGQNIKDIQLRPTSDGFLELACKDNEEVPKSTKYSTKSNLNLSGKDVPKTTTYTKESFTYQFGSENLYIQIIKLHSILILWMELKQFQFLFVFFCFHFPLTFVFFCFLRENMASTTRSLIEFRFIDVHGQVSIQYFPNDTCCTLVSCRNYIQEKWTLSPD